MESVVVLTGGGIKGAVVAGRYAADHDVLLVHADFGQPSARAEAMAVESLSGAWPNCRCVKVRLTNVLEPEGIIAGSDQGRGVVSTADPVVPSPGALRGVMPILLSIGIQNALRVGARTIVTGLSRFCPAEHLGLTETQRTSPQFHELLQTFDVLAETLSHTSQRARVEAPLMELGGADIVKLGHRLDVPLVATRSCHSGAASACGRCNGCQHRTAAFVGAGLLDPALPPSSSTGVPAGVLTYAGTEAGGTQS